MVLVNKEFHLNRVSHCIVDAESYRKCDVFLCLGEDVESFVVAAEFHCNLVSGRSFRLVGSGFLADGNLYRSCCTRLEFDTAKSLVLCGVVFGIDNESIAFNFCLNPLRSGVTPLRCGCGDCEPYGFIVFCFKLDCA